MVLILWCLLGDVLLMGDTENEGACTPTVLFPPTEPVPHPKGTLGKNAEPTVVPAVASTAVSIALIY
jgi:hypothetical protein